MSDPEPLPSASLVICSRNRHELLRQTAVSVLEGDALPQEIIIVDQSDTRLPVETLVRLGAPCRIRYLWSSPMGVSRARNQGIGAAHNEIVVLLDDDMFVAAGWFKSLVRSLVNGGPRIVTTGRVLSSQSEDAGGLAPSTRTDQAPAAYRGRVGIDPLYSGNMALYRSAYHEVGGFDPRLGPGTEFPAAEDNDFGFRLLEAGYTIRYVPQAIVYHRAWREGRDNARLRWNYGRGQGAFYAKHLHWHDLHTLGRLIWEIGHSILGFPVRLLRHRKVPYDDLVYVVALLSGAGDWSLRKRL